MSNASEEPADENRGSSSAPPAEELNPYKDRRLTIPNVICVLRIIGSFCMLWLAFTGHANAFVITFVVLHLSDWVDGKLARWLHQRSDFGARLDSASDAILYGCLIIGSLILKWDVLRNEVIWLAIPLLSYAITSGYGLWKYGRVPSYHTYAAKWGNWVVLGAAVALLLDWSLWPLRFAAVFGTLTNLETTVITYMLPTWQADVLSLKHAMRRKKHVNEST